MVKTIHSNKQTTYKAGTGGNEFLRSQQGRTEERMFDRAFGPDATQEEVSRAQSRGEYRNLDFYRDKHV